MSAKTDELGEGLRETCGEPSCSSTIGTKGDFEKRPKSMLIGDELGIESKNQQDGLPTHSLERPKKRTFFSSIQQLYVKAGLDV